MADTKISALTAHTASALAEDDEIAVVDTSATQTKRLTVSELRKAVGSYSAALTVYVATTGNDSNDGSSGTPLLTLGAAFDYIEALSAYFSGNVIVDVAAGSYDGAALGDGILSKNRITIRGVDNGAGVRPTTIISGSVGASTYGLFFQRGANIQVKDIEVNGFSGVAESGIAAADFVDLYCDNVWLIDSYYNLNLRSFVRYRFKGGCINGDGYAGVLAFDFCLGTVGYNGTTVPTVDPTISGTSDGDGTYIGVGVRGVLWNENSQGHVDYTLINGAGPGGIGIECNHASRVNSISLTVKNCATGVRLRTGSIIAGSPTYTTNTVDKDISGGFDSDKNLHETRNLGAVAMLGVNTVGGTLTTGTAYAGYTAVITNFATLPAGALRAGCMLRIEFTGKITKVTNTNDTTIRIYWDGNSVAAIAAPTDAAFTGAAVRYKCVIDILGVTNTTQEYRSELVISDSTGAVNKRVQAQGTASLDCYTDDKTISIYSTKAAGDAFDVENATAMLFGTFE